MEGLQYISCLRFSMQLLLAEAFFVWGWDRKQHITWRLLLAGMGYVLAASAVFAIFSKAPGYSPVIYTMYYMSLFFLTLVFMPLCFYVKAKEILFAGVCGYATQHIGFAVYMIFKEVTGITLGPAADFFLLRVLPYLLVGMIIYAVLIKRYEGSGELKDRDIRMIMLAFVILMTVIFVSVLVDSPLFRQDSGILRNVLCKLYAILCCALALFVAFNLSRQNRMLREKEMMETMLYNLKEQQRLSKENINIINIKCHDLKYRISKIARIEDAGEQKEYIESIRNAISIYDNIYQTGNDVLDLVLTEKSLLCDQYRIKLSSMVEGTAMEFMNTTDVYALFGNLLDNAMESVMKESDEEKRIISFQITKRSQGCHIHIDNYCKENVTFSEGLPVTTKTEKEYHGFGVRSIRYIVDKYEGDMLMQALDQRFQVDILFYR